MNLNKILKSANDKFKEHLIDFCQNNDFTKLTPEKAEEFSSGLKHSLSQTGKHVFKSLLESFDCRKDVIVRDNKRFRFKKLSTKYFLTPFGEVQIDRRLYQADKGGSSIIPLDEKWGMVGEYATFDVREAICFSCGLITYDETASLFAKSSLFHPSSTAVKHIATRTGSFVEENKGEINQGIRKDETVPEKTQAIVVSLDGANVMLREPGPRKGRKIQRPKMSYHNEEKTSFRNAMVGTVSFYTSDDEGKPERLESRHIAQMPEPNFLTFRQYFDEEVSATINKTSNEIDKLLILDAHHSVQGYAKVNPLFQDFHFIIDFYHAMEHLSKASEAIFGKSTEENKKWYYKWKTRLLEDEHSVEQLYRSLKYYREQIPPKKKELLKPELTYFKKHKSKMNYALYVKLGLPIGNGPVEAGCKSLIKSRLCRSGMRWNRQGGQNILNFRTYIKSNRWESFWKQYKEWKLAA